MKTYENFSEEITAKLKAEEYRKYIGKYVIFEYIIWGLKQEYYLAYCSNSLLTETYFKFDIFAAAKDSDLEINKRVKYNREPYVLDIQVLSAYDTFEEAKENYELLLNTNKYNL